MLNKRVLVSVIIPVYNGSQYIQKTCQCILKQKIQSIELILVENFSTDNSLEICKNIENMDSRVKVVQSFEKGTTFARKKGVEVAKGDYIFFCDQDDRLKDKNSLKKMYNTIVSTNCQICQFSVINEYFWGIKKYSQIISNKSNSLLEKGNIINKEIAGLFGDKTSLINNTVFSKIYSTSLLKDAVNRINMGLFTCEDTYLIFCCITSPLLENVYVEDQAFYIHKRGTGITATKRFSMLLFDEYNIIKPIINDFYREKGYNLNALFAMHEESLHFMLAYLIDVSSQIDQNELFKLIEQLDSYSFIGLAKSYFRNVYAHKKLYPDLEFMSSNYSPQEYYQFFKERFETNNCKTLRSRIKKSILKIANR